MTRHASRIPTKRKPIMNTARNLAAGLLLLCASAVGQAADIRPGLWEFRSTRMSVAGMPDMSAQMAEMQRQLKNLPPETQRMLQQQMASRGVQMGNDGSVRSCITPEQAKQDNIYSGRTDGGCTLASVDKTGNTVRGRLNCTQPQGTADFETTLHGPEHFTTRVKMRSPQGDMQADTDARWLSAQCPAAAGAKP